MNRADFINVRAATKEGTPVVGVLVEVIDGDGRVITDALTNPAGAVRLTLPAAPAYTLRCTDASGTVRETPVSSRGAGLTRSSSSRRVLAPSTTDQRTPHDHYQPLPYFRDALPAGGSRPDRRGVAREPLRPLPRGQSRRVPSSPISHRDHDHRLQRQLRADGPDCRH